MFSLSMPGFFFRRRKKILLRKMIDAGSFRQVLRCGADLLNQESKEQVRNWITSKQTSVGGFPDRAGNCDLYYTLFGFFLAEALEADSVFPLLRDYIRKTATEKDHRGIDLFCMAILNASLFPVHTENKRLTDAIRKISGDKEVLQNSYTPFLVILSLLSLHDYRGVIRLLKVLEASGPETGKPCTVVAAQQVVAYFRSGGNCGITGNVRDAAASTGPLSPYYRENGGFAALKETREPDLLSTAAALFALRFMDCDLRLIRPGCLEFINCLYHDGGFSAVKSDTETDVEYTFYGLLALGAMNTYDGQK